MCSCRFQSLTYNQGSQHLPHFPLCIVVNPPPSSFCYPRKTSLSQTNLTSFCPTLVLHFYFSSYPSRHTVLIYSLPMCKPPHHSLIHSALQHFHSSTSTNLLVPNTVNLCCSNYAYKQGLDRNVRDLTMALSQHDIILGTETLVSDMHKLEVLVPIYGHLVLLCQCQGLEPKGWQHT